jgi:hypothetical protein
MEESSIEIVTMRKQKTAKSSILARASSFYFDVYISTEE